MTADYPGWDFCLGLSFWSLMKAIQGIIVPVILSLIVRWIIELFRGYHDEINPSNMLNNTALSIRLVGITSSDTSYREEWTCSFRLCESKGALTMNSDGKNAGVTFRLTVSAAVVPCPSSLTNNNHCLMPVPVPPALPLPDSRPQDLCLSLWILVGTASLSCSPVVSDDIWLLRSGVQKACSCVSPGLSQYFWLGVLS